MSARDEERWQIDEEIETVDVHLFLRALTEVEVLAWKRALVSRYQHQLFRSRRRGAVQRIPRLERRLNTVSAFGVGLPLLPRTVLLRASA